MSVWWVLFGLGFSFRRIGWQCAVFTKAVQIPAWIEIASGVVLAMNETLGLRAVF